MRETFFRLGEQKFNDFSVGEAKIGGKQSRQSNSKYNFMQCIFRKRYTQCTMAPEAGKFSRIFALKVTLESVRQGSFPAGTPGNGVPKVILTVGTAFKPAFL